MKLAPIINPHARVKQNKASSKEEERDALMQQTKAKVQERIFKRAEEKKKNKTAIMGGSKAETGFDMGGNEGFSLGDQVNAETISMHLLSEGYMQAYIDFFYLTDKD